MIQATGPMVLTHARAGCAADAARHSIDEESIRLSGGDSVELSEAAEARIGGEPFRAELVQRIRAEIAEGAYLTDDKLDAAVDRLHRELFR